jgi:hypothetical protein
MPHVFQRITYSQLSPLQQESYNYQKLSSLLADFGYVTIRLSDDWNGADFIAQHMQGGGFLKVQLKGRLFFAKMYGGKDISIAFPDGPDWYVYPHDEVLRIVHGITGFMDTEAWRGPGIYHFPRISKAVKEALIPYRVG